jgi:hypothetical protein
MTTDALSAALLEGIDLAALLDDVRAFCSRFVAYPDEHTRAAHTLWIAHTHCMDAWDSTPRIAFLSPEPGSGKTRAIEVTELLVPSPVLAVNVTAAYLFRKVGDPAGRSTILFDEIDTVFGPKAKENEDIRGLLNAGHRKGAVAGRCVVKGKTILTEEIPAYCAVALAGLGGLPDTLLSRSVIIRMKRRAPDEVIEPFRRRLHEVEGYRLRDKLANWGAAATEALQDAWPELPESVTDRNADIWESLIAIADLAGHAWPGRARGSAVALVAASMAGTPSLGVRLLADIRTAFGDDEAMPAADLLSALHRVEESPWGDLRGKPLDSRGLSTRLGGYGIKSHDVRIGERSDNKVVKGYRRQDFHDAWVRYLTPLANDPNYNNKEGNEGAVGVPPIESATTATTATRARSSASGPQSNAAAARQIVGVPTEPCPSCGAIAWSRRVGFRWLCDNCAPWAVASTPTSPVRPIERTSDPQRERVAT